jgi:MFS family permease
MPKNTNNTQSPSDKISRSAWKTLAILSLIATMSMYAETMLVPAIPDLIKDFSISYNTSSWILTTYLIAGAIMTPISGKLSDIYGKKKVLLIIMIIYTVGVSSGGFTTNIYSMLLVRIIQGVGMSMFPIAFGIIRDQFPRSKIAIGQGIITSMFAAGAVIGLVAGGHLIQNYGWQYTFFSIIPIALTLLVIIKKLIHVDDAHNPNITSEGMKNEKLQNKIDIPGAIALAISVTSFLLTLTFVENGTSGSYLIIELLGIAIISLILFVLIERKVKSPLVDFKVLLHKSIFPANMMVMIVGLSMFMVFQTIPVLVRSPMPLGFGEDPLATANVQLPFALVLLIFGPTSGFIISKLGSIKPIIAGSIIGAAGFYSLFLFHSTESLVAVNLALLSAGLSLTNVGAMNIVMLATPKQSAGVSLGMSTLIRIIGASIGPTIAGMYMQTHQVAVNGFSTHFPSADSYNLIFLTATIISIISIILAVILWKTVPKHHVHAV